MKKNMICVDVYLDTLIDNEKECESDNIATIAVEKEDFRKFFTETKYEHESRTFEDFLENYICEDTEGFVEWLRRNKKIAYFSNRKLLADLYPELKGTVRYGI